jgi:mannose-6-phosphate isomerase-like protein (cupin superfamily)
MIYRKKSELSVTPIEHCMGGKGIVMMEKLLDAPLEMYGKGRAYVRHTLHPGVTIGRHTHTGEMESMVIVAGHAVHTINGETQHLSEGDIIAAQDGDTHEIACEGKEDLVLIAQVLYTK